MFLLACDISWNPGWTRDLNFFLFGCFILLIVYGEIFLCLVYFLCNKPLERQCLVFEPFSVPHSVIISSRISLDKDVNISVSECTLNFHFYYGNISIQLLLTSWYRMLSRCYNVSLACFKMCLTFYVSIREGTQKSYPSWNLELSTAPIHRLLRVLIQGLQFWQEV